MLDLPRYSNDTCVFPIMKDTVETYIVEFYRATTSVSRINAVLHICYAALQQKKFISVLHSQTFVVEMIKCILRNQEWILTYMPLFEQYMWEHMKGYEFIERKDDYEIAAFFEGVVVDVSEVEEVYNKKNIPI